jgi:hypothetical protein
MSGNGFDGSNSRGAPAFVRRDLNRAREIATDQRNRGYKVWIEDENGRQVDEEPLKNEQANRSLRRFAIGALNNSNA